MTQTKKCDALLCRAAAKWSPVLVLRAPVEYEPCPEVPASISLGVCDKHKEGVTLADLISDDGFERIQQGMDDMGRVRFDPERTTLRWQTIAESDEAFNQMRGH